MSAVPASAPVSVGRRSSLSWAVKDTLAIVGRNLTTIYRTPQLLVFSTIQPVIFVLLFRYVFGGAITIPGLTVPYVDYLMPGRTIADLVRDVFVVLLMAVVGFIVGFRIHTNALVFAGGLLVLLLFAFALAWVFGFIGLSTGQAETAQAASFPILAILTFASSAFVSPETMPPLLQWFAEHQPLSITVNALRACTIGGPTATPVFQSVLWSVGIIAVFAPIAVRKYRRVA